MKHPPLKILLVEDASADAVLLRQALEDELEVPFTLEHVERLAVALPLLSRGDIDVVLLDLKLPDSEGLETLVRVRSRAPGVPVVVLTAAADQSLATQSLHQGAQDYLMKDEVHLSRNLLSRSLRYAIERKRAEEEIRKAHEQNEHLLASITSILIGVDADGHVTHWNDVAEATFGLPASRFLHRPLAECAIPWDLQKILNGIAVCRRSGRTTRVEDITFTRPDGRNGVLGITIIPLKGDPSTPSGLLLFGADVTDRKLADEDRRRLQTQLSQVQKMETVGRFAGGIAHDFQNFLQVILGFAWLIRSRHREDKELMSDLEEIVHAGESASGMVRQLLAFARRQALRPTILEINQTLRNMERLLQQFMGERIRVELQLDPDPLMVKLDPTGLEQILINLSSNARDSMQGSGTLTVLTVRRSLDATFVESHPWAKPGEYVRISVRDTGSGMDPEVAAHIFEPFFTTKQVGRGTGLGLAVVYGMVQQHDGFIDIDTAQGKGATFHLYFPHQAFPSVPRAPVKEEQPVGAALATAAVPSSAGRNAKPRVLIVDDDPAIRLFCERTLQGVCELTAVGSSRAALRNQPVADRSRTVAETVHTHPPPAAAPPRLPSKSRALCESRW